MGRRGGGRGVTTQIALWLTPETIAALRAEARRRGVKQSTVAEDLLARGLAADTAGRLETQALPVFTTVVQQVIAEQLRRQERRLVAPLGPLARDAGLAARLAYAHLYRDHPEVAENDWQEASAQVEETLHDSGPAGPGAGRARMAQG